MMIKNPRLLTQILAAIAIAVGTATAISQTSQAQSNPSDTFFCSKSNGIPETRFHIPGGGSSPMIRWVSRDWGSKWSPLARCKAVSKRFQKAYEGGNLEFITYGQKNGYPIICAATVASGPCVDQLFTLKLDDDPEAILADIFDIRSGLSSRVLEQRRPLRSTYYGRSYYNVREIIRNSQEGRSSYNIRELMY